MARLEDIYDRLKLNGGTLTKHDIDVMLEEGDDSFLSPTGRFLEVCGYLFLLVAFFALLYWVS